MSQPRTSTASGGDIQIVGSGLTGRGTKPPGAFFLHVQGLAWDGQQDRQPERLPAAAPRGLGFLTARRPQVNWSHHTAAQGSESKCSSQQAESDALLGRPGRRNHPMPFLLMEAAASLPVRRHKPHRKRKRERICDHVLQPSHILGPCRLQWPELEPGMGAHSGGGLQAVIRLRLKA